MLAVFIMTIMILVVSLHLMNKWNMLILTASQASWISVLKVYVDDYNSISKADKNIFCSCC